MTHPSRLLAVAVATALVIAGCGADDGEDSDDDRDEDGTELDTVVPEPAGTDRPTDITVPAEADEQADRIAALPPANGEFDYQLGGAYEPDPGVEVLSRDRLDPADPDRYTICYVNGFQTQSVEAELWTGANADLVLRDDDGDPLVDPHWPGEMILDTSSADTRERLADIVGGWIEGCAADGFAGIEIDNLDTFTRFPERLTEDDAVAFARLLTDRAHEAGVAIAQKNTAELLERRDETGFDFAVVEECNAYDECDVFTAAYGDQIYVIEYERDAFEQGCSDFPDVSIVLRDHDVTPRGEDGYVRDVC